MLNAEPIRRRNPLVPVLIAVAVVAAGLATWSVLSWQDSRDDRAEATAARDASSDELRRVESDESIGFARTRDEVSKAGEAAITTLNTLDYRKIDEGLDAWEKATTGALHDEIVNRRSTTKQALEQAKTATTADALSMAVTELDERAGTATMIAAMNVTVIADGKQPQQKYVRIRATLKRTDGGWKLSGLGPVG